MLLLLVLPASAGKLTLAGAENFESDDGEAIVELYLRKSDRLSDDLLIFLIDQDIFLPFDDLFLLLQFPIKGTASGASGWFVSEGQRFTLNTSSRQVVAAGRRYTYPAGAVRTLDDQRYVSGKALATWFDFDLVADLRALRVTIIPAGKLPVETQRERADNRAFGSITHFRSSLPRVPPTYQMAHVPGLEVSLFGGYSSGALNPFSDGGTIRAYGDVLGAHGQFFATGTHRGIASTRLNIGRSDPEGGLLGSLNATRWSIGDIGAPGLVLVTGPEPGRGVRVSSRPGGYVGAFDRIDLEDVLPAGWEVELYRNDLLLAAFGPSDAGRYKFPNVPLLRGANNIRLEFYGPQGQRRTERQQYGIGADNLPPGKLHYDVSLMQVGRTVLGLSPEDQRQQYGGQALGGVARFDFGLNRSVSLNGGVALVPTAEDQSSDSLVRYRTFASAGLRTVLKGVAVSFDGALDDQGGVAASIGAQAKLWNWNAGLRHEQYWFGYNTSANYAVVAESQGVKTSFTNLRFDRAWPALWSGLTAQVGLGLAYSTYTTTPDTWSVGGNVSLRGKGFAFAQSISFDDAYATGSGLALGTRLNKRFANGVSVRGGLSYDLWNELDLKALSLGLSAPLPYKLNLNLNYTHAWPRSVADSEVAGVQNYSASVTRKFNLFNLGLSAGYSRFPPSAELTDDFRVAVSLSFNTFHDGDELAVTSERIGRQAALRPVAYLDRNNNGQQDRGEPLIAKAKVLHRGQRAPYYTRTDGKGRSGYTNPNQWIDIKLDPAGMPQENYSPGNKGVAVLPRAGVVTTVKLPVITTGDIEGKVVLAHPDGDRPLPNVTVEIYHHATRKVIAKIATEFDGLFAFSAVPTGTYTLRIAAKQAKGLALIESGATAITLTPETGLLEDVVIRAKR